MNEPRGVAESEEKKSQNFIEIAIEKDLEEGKNNKRVHTRFPPEPNGYLHIGHAKSICLNFGLAKTFNGKCNLRFDDTNPDAEEVEYVDSIKNDVKWLGFDWDGEHFASDYFETLYDFAVTLIKKGLAYVDDQNADEISAQKGTPTEPGLESPNRNRSVQENLDLFKRMRDGEFENGHSVLRAKVDMASPNMHMRDPIMYRIKKTDHHRTGDAWCIYPTYDFAHGQSDFIESITHSICTLEFEVHRPLYDWFLDQLSDGEERPRQIEFARLNLSYTVMSKRKLLELVKGGLVSGWDDPRMPTISGLRRRGYTPQSIRNFAERVGVARRDGVIDVALLEFSVREDLNRIAQRRMAVLDPLKITIVNYPEDQEEMMMATNNPEDEQSGKREIPFSRELYIERDDFMEDAPRKFFRLKPEGYVRLKYAYVIKCIEVVKDGNGKITELKCEYLPESKSGSGVDIGIKVKGTIHWLSAKHAKNAEVRLYDRLFIDEDPNGHKDKDFKEFLNPDSLQILTECFVEPALHHVTPGEHYQFERKGYYSVDPDSIQHKPVFNLTVSLKDSWAKAAKK